MALNSSGPISLGGSTTGQSVNLELAQGATATISFNDASVRTLTATSVGTTLVLPGGFYGKSTRTTIAVTISSNTLNYIANTAKASGYVAGNTDTTFTINNGVVVGSASTGSYAFTVDTSWAAGDTVTVVNNGKILGAGGAGGDDTTVVGSPGGTAIRVQRTTTITNAGTVGGGGGGGGWGVGTDYKQGYWAGGGGGGQGQLGGAGGVPYNSNGGGTGTASSPGAGGAGINATDGGNGGLLGSTGAYGGGTNAGGSAGAALLGLSFVNSGVGITGTVYGGQS